ncbi:CLUMA_CG015611, isoform A [Clunio marinus]|uniref:CLUMA_CG015611, isoform A n=1 Tax=Clunio marinus TaxID=568069 RepID=A0A1J1IPC6_9DIPT|nr:CLUMA_CG015611, isoform A [Clunio marinus]
MITIFYTYTTKEEIDSKFMFEVLNYYGFGAYFNMILLFIGFLVIIIKNYLEMCHQNLHGYSESFGTFQNKIKEVMTIQNDITQAIKLFNESFGFLYFGLYVYLFTNFATSLYFAYTSLIYDFNDSQAESTLNILVNMIWILPFNIFNQLIGINCSQVQNKVFDIKRTLTKLYDDDHSGISGQLLSTVCEDDFIFTANGFFPINRAIFMNIIISTSTFLIVAIQFYQQQ